MKEKQSTSATMQWLLPTTILFIAIIIMFADFYTSSGQSAQTQVEKSFTSVAEEYAFTLMEKLTGIQKTGKIVAAIMEQRPKGETELAQEAVAALYEQTDAYMVVMADLSGRGINQNQEKLSLADTDYFEQISEGSEQFLYLEDDGINQRKAILSVLPIYQSQGEEKEVSGVLLLYYPVENFDNLMRVKEFEGYAFYILTDSEGNCLESAEGISTVLTDTNIWDLLEDEKAREHVRNKMQNGTGGIEDAKNGEQEYRLVYTPVGINDWYMVMGVKQDYVTLIQNESWNDTKMMFVKLVVIIGVFLAVIVGMNIVSKIRSNEKEKDLADKADTDLLTELNNKLATERKIKEYIMEHSGEQALLFVLDIDNFKKINDTMGHAFGDEVLSAIGHGIKGEFRVSDVIGRTGGDEFMVFLKDVNSDTMIEQEAARLTRFFKELRVGEYVKYSPTASIGVAVYPRDAKDFEGLYKAADRALYKAKERGKNQMAFYGDEE